MVSWLDQFLKTLFNHEKHRCSLANFSSYLCMDIFNSYFRQKDFVSISAICHS